MKLGRMIREKEIDKVWDFPWKISLLSERKRDFERKGWLCVVIIRIRWVNRKKNPSSHKIWRFEIPQCMTFAERREEEKCVERDNCEQV